MYTIIHVTAAGCYTVGLFTPDNEWLPISDWQNIDDAREEISFLNGNLRKEVREWVLSEYHKSLKEKEMTNDR